MSDHSHEPGGYQLVLSLGPVPEMLLAARVIDLTPAEPTAESILAALAASGITPPDLRARTMITLSSEITPVEAILAYTALTGYAGRHLDVLCGAALLSPAPLLRAAQAMHAERPSAQVPVIGVGATLSDIDSILLDHPLTPADAVRIRWAKRVRFIPDNDVTTALSQFIVVSALRTRATTERLPYLCDGSEPYDPETPLALAGCDLDALRLAALALRRSSRSGDRDSLVEAFPPSDRDARLAAAADVPIEKTLTRLGARHNPDTDLWHCPRPSRHTHGDATASMRIQNDKVRCYRCDAERVDSLRLVIDVTGLSIDEAADWLLSDAVVLADA